jgi:acetyl-CoA carboxylase biotin carboxyl carrier protein
MDIKEIQHLIRFVAKSGATEVNLETEEFKIIIKTSPDQQSGNGDQQFAQHFAQVIPSPMAAAPQTVQSMPQNPPAPASDSNGGGGNPDEADENYIAVRSPMIGTMYRRPSPDKDPFISVGDEIKEGDVVCVIEAMKLFNEIESEVSGKVVKILVDDQTPVEYDQPLFLVDPS